MNTTLRITALYFGFFICGQVTLFAQPLRSTPPASRPAKLIAVLDVGNVFKNHARFKRQIDEVKGEIETFETQINQKRTEMTNLGKSLENYKPGSREYRQIETKLAKDTSDIQVRAQLKRKEILDREARIYYETYREILDVVDRLAQHHGIALVIRYDGQKIDPVDRSAVQKGVNRTVLYQGNIDLTPAVLQQLSNVQAREPPSSSIR